MPDTLLWLRRDLRRHDHPALGVAAQAADGASVLPLFVLDPRLWNGAGVARRAWLHSSLTALNSRYDGALVVRHGAPDVVVPEVAAQVGASTVHITAETTPYGRRRDAAVRTALEASGRALVASGTPYAVGPGTLTNRSGSSYQVFTPFLRAWRTHGWPAPAGDPRRLSWRQGMESDGLGDIWPRDVDQMPSMPDMGEQAALGRWHRFLDEGVDGYAEEGNRPDRDGTSQMSAHLHFGEIHPRTMLAGLAAHATFAKKGAQTYLAELAWREFYADVLWHQPRSAWHDLKPALSQMAYADPGPTFDAWKQGRTGFPLVDAGMRQLCSEGWMHNRLRMVTASFLCKDLHVWWPYGARHFLDLLRDGDVASNNHGWQWVAGTGTDPSPYFRVFNPVSQGLRFDPDGDYVRRYVPELRHLPGKAAHEPWEAEDGYAHGYPQRVVDHAAERAEALRRYQAARDAAR